MYGGDDEGVDQALDDGVAYVGDRVYRNEVANLFESLKAPIELIKSKDLLEYLEDTLDHCEKVADMVRGVVMKYA